jgi:pimeloyl-ACP methyl ester carboxylesterase
MPAGREVRHLVDDGTLSLVYDEYGERLPVVVLLHGLAGYAGEWKGSAKWLTANHRVVALDQRGHGRSSRLPGDTSRSAYVADVVSVIESLDAGPVVLIGQSLGGHTAMLAAAQRPDLVAALVVAEASPGRDPDGPHRVRQWLSTWPVPFGSRASAFDFFQTMKYFRSGLAAQVWADGLEERPDGWWPRFDVEVMIDSLAEVATRDYWDRWVAIRCPTLLVGGEHGALSGEEVEPMLALLPRAQFAQIDGAGHDVHLDRPERWRTVVTEFLASAAG